MTIMVSIHALLAECDSTSISITIGIVGFNPRTPCGVRQGVRGAVDVHSPFQSTHSLRSATDKIVSYSSARLFQSTHSLRSATHFNFNHYRNSRVSIHALLAECDPSPVPRKMSSAGFNPRTPCGVRRVHVLEAVCEACVSIHALLAECDTGRVASSRKYVCFNPRTPCGVRLRPTLYIATQQSKSYFAPTSLKRPSLHGCSF